MAMPFSRSLRSLADDHPRYLMRAVAAIAAFIILWALWLTLAELPVYRASSSVRIEQREQLYAVASFAPAQALGHIQTGQQGWLQLDGFSSLQYGKIPVTVTSISSTIPEQPVRVELALGPAGGGVPLQAGMSGRVEIEIERTTPATLLLRTVGAMLGDEVGE